MRYQWLTVAGLTIVASVGCKSTNHSSGLNDAAVVSSTNSLQAVGLDVYTNTPVVTKIDPNVTITSDWGYSSGREYWLYSSRGKYMTFSATGKYAPYKNSAACSGKENDSSSACSVSPSTVTQACQYIAGLTLQGILESNPPELEELKAKYGGSLSMYGWMNDGYSDNSYATQPWQGPFNWRSTGDSIQTNGACPDDYKRLQGYLKWVSSIDKNGFCKTPSRGQFNALMATIKSCLEKNNQ